MFLLQGYVTELLPGGKVSGHEAAQLENMSKISYLLIFLFGFNIVHFHTFLMSDKTWICFVSDGETPSEEMEYSEI